MKQRTLREMIMGYSRETCMKEFGPFCAIMYLTISYTVKWYEILSAKSRIITIETN